jgi:hypothetical protein
MAIAVNVVSIEMANKGQTTQMKLTPEQTRIAEVMNVSPDVLLSRLSRSVNSVDDPDDDVDNSDEQDEIQRAQNHLECCRDADEDTMSRVTMARDCLNDFLAKNGGEVKDSANSAGLVFPHRRSI